MSIGQRLKEARKSCNMSQVTLAEKIGTSREVITNIELGKITTISPFYIAINNIVISKIRILVLSQNYGMT